MTEPVQVQVRCLGQMHTIRLDERGRLHFDGHPHGAWRTWPVQEALSSRQCRCSEVLTAWRSRNIERLPTTLAQTVRTHTMIIDRRQTDRYLPAVNPLRARLDSYVQLHATNALHRCNYRRSASRWAGGDHTVNVLLISRTAMPRLPSCSGTAERVRSSNEKWIGTNSALAVTISTSWLVRVHSQGIARVAGRFILDATPIDPPRCADKAWTVLYAAQGAGFDIHREEGVVLQSGSTKVLAKTLRSAINALIKTVTGCYNETRSAS